MSIDVKEKEMFNRNPSESDFMPGGWLLTPL
jgi:hypothetical protein